MKEIFSGVPQGARWSPGLWNFDIHDLPDHVLHGELFSYADDLVLWYEITEENRNTIIDQINEDLESVRLWGLGNKTEFEPTKTYSLLIAGKGRGRGIKFDISGIEFCDTPVEQVSELKIVGFIFEEEMTWSSMVKKCLISCLQDTDGLYKEGRLNLIQDLLSFLVVDGLPAEQQ